MNTTAAVDAANTHRTIVLPALGTLLPHLGGTFWALMRAKPGSSESDYALIVPHGPQYETKAAWGSLGQDESGAACMWDGLGNTRALMASGRDHPAAKFCSGLNGPDGQPLLYLPSMRELKALFVNGCDAFSKDGWYWSSTQFSRDLAYLQSFANGNSYYDDKSWEGGRARAVRRCTLESLIA